MLLFILVFLLFRFYGGYIGGYIGTISNRYSKNFFQIKKNFVCYGTLFNKRNIYLSNMSELNKKSFLTKLLFYIFTSLQLLNCTFTLLFLIFRYSKFSFPF